MFTEAAQCEYNVLNYGLQLLDSLLDNLLSQAGTQPSPHGDKIKGCFTSLAVPLSLLSSHKGLVSVLHIGVVRSQFTETVTLPNISTW